MTESTTPAPTASAPRDTSRDTRNTIFDLMRHLFAATVIVGHSILMCHVVRSGAYLDAPKAVQSFDPANESVRGFFLLSGYLITQSWERSATPFVFLARRAARLYPGFVGALVVAFFLIAPFVDNNHGASTRQSMSTRDLVVQALTLGRFEPRILEIGPYQIGPLNPSLWTIRIELQCYLVTLLVGLLARISPAPRRRTVFAASMTSLGALSLIVWYAFAHKIILSDANVPTSLIPYLQNQCLFFAYFATGAAFSFFGDRLTPPRGAALRLGVSLAVLIGLAVSKQWEGFSLIPLAFFVFSLAGLRPRALSSPLPVDISYGLYLYGWPVQLVLLKIAPELMDIPLVFGLFCVAATSVPAGISWFLLEKPTLDFLRRKTARRV